MSILDHCTVDRESRTYLNISSNSWIGLYANGISTDDNQTDDAASPVLSTSVSHDRPKCAAWKSSLERLQTSARSGDNSSSEHLSTQGLSTNMASVVHDSPLVGPLQLPDELIGAVLGFLDGRSLTNFELTSVLTRRYISGNPGLFKQLLVSHLVLASNMV